jgi:hypothetical protein
VASSAEDARADADLRAFVAGGVAIGVATCDETLHPFFARGFGPELSADGQRLRLCVTAPADSAVRANLERGCPIAIGFSPPTIARAVQMKGSVEAIGELDEADRQRMARHLDEFIVEAGQFGVAETLVRRFAAAVDCVAVTYAIEEVFDQTPGPSAGHRR